MADTHDDEETARLEAELRDLREKRLAIEQQNEARRAGARARQELENERRAIADAEAIGRVEEAHGPIDGKKMRAIDTELGVVIIKRPNHLHYKRFRDTEEAKTDDLIKLVKPCLVHPDGAGFERMIEELPGTLDRVANAVVALAGFRAKEAQGKS